MLKLSAPLLLLTASVANAQVGIDALSSLTTVHDYVQKRSSSYDRTGGNADAIPIGAGKSVTIFDATGPAEITHIWITIASPEAYHLKKLVLRAYWDDEATPSVETPIGDFFGLGLGQYFTYDSENRMIGAYTNGSDYVQYAYAEGTELAARRGVYDALSLYLNFINLFTFLLQIMGVRNNN